MGDKTVSIAQQYHKVSQMWQEALNQKHWQLAIWATPYEDIEMISGFFEIERTVLGKTDAIYFKFNSVYTSLEEYQELLWNEFEGWFAETPEERYDMHSALIKDGYLKKPFVPNASPPKTPAHLISEIERFRTSLISVDATFIIEMGIGMHHADLREWYWKLMHGDIPKQIRFVTIDAKEKRLVKGFRSKHQKHVLELFPELHMASAIKSEMKKGAQGQDPNEPSAQYQQVVLELMEALPNNDKVEPLVQKLLHIAQTMKQPSILTTAYLVAAHVYNTMRKPKEGLKHIDKGIDSTYTIQTSGRPEEWYPLWRACNLFKASFLIGLKKREDAFALYETVAEEASKHKDHFYIMESYRMCATLKMKKKEYQMAFEHASLALYGGSFLPENIRRRSTYLYAANTAYQCVDHVYDNSREKKRILEEHLELWIGNDWKTLISSEENLNAHYAPLPSQTETETLVAKTEAL